MRRDSDTTQDFIEMCCERVSGARIERGELFTSYERHCNEEGRQTLSKNGFYKAILSKGFKKIKLHGYYYFGGISIKKTSPQDALKSSPSGLTDEDGFLKVDDGTFQQRIGEVFIDNIEHGYHHACYIASLKREEGDDEDAET